MKKILLLGLMLATTAFAGEFQSTSGRTIHSTTLNVGGQPCCARFAINTKVGHLQNGSCQYTRETDAEQTSGCDTMPFGVFKLDGDRLQQLVGKDWDCAATKISNYNAEGVDEYQLVKDAQGNLTSTSPDSGNITLKLCG